MFIIGRRVTQSRGLGPLNVGEGASHWSWQQGQSRGSVGPGWGLASAFLGLIGGFSRSEGWRKPCTRKHTLSSSCSKPAEACGSPWFFTQPHVKPLQSEGTGDREGGMKSTPDTDDLTLVTSPPPCCLRSLHVLRVPNVPCPPPGSPRPASLRGAASPTMPGPDALPSSRTRRTNDSSPRSRAGALPISSPESLGSFQNTDAWAAPQAGVTVGVLFHGLPCFYRTGETENHCSRICSCFPSRRLLTRCLPLSCCFISVVASPLKVIGQWQAPAPLPSLSILSARHPDTSTAGL